MWAYCYWMYLRESKMEWKEIGATSAIKFLFIIINCNVQCENELNTQCPWSFSFPYVTLSLTHSLSHSFYCFFSSNLISDWLETWNTVVAAFFIFRLKWLKHLSVCILFFWRVKKKKNNFFSLQTFVKLIFPAHFFCFWSTFSV